MYISDGERCSIGCWASCRAELTAQHAIIICVHLIVWLQYEYKKHHCAMLLLLCRLVRIVSDDRIYYNMNTAHTNVFTGYINSFIIPLDVL